LFESNGESRGSEGVKEQREGTELHSKRTKKNERLYEGVGADQQAEAANDGSTRRTRLDLGG
jgi:hypothetical protein